MGARRFFVRLFAGWARALTPKPPDPDVRSALKLANAEIERLRATEADQWERYKERCCELIEARSMTGSGPWLAFEARAALERDPNIGGKEIAKLREANPIVSQGAFGDIELALQNVEWRREINLSWMEFSRWGIQQIMLVSRLYYIKNPLVRRLIDIAAAYVFGRGVEVSCADDDANEVLKEAFEANSKVLGQHGLVQLERQKFYDGNLFFAFFTDTNNTGKVQVRNMEATEIIDILTNPDDADEPWYYRRQWVERNFDVATGAITTEQQDAWYPDIAYSPDTKPKTIGSYPVVWDVPILHRKCGHVSKWRFGCPIVYPMLDWAKEARKFLEACATVKRALAQFSMMLTTKGGQQAIEGTKQQLETTIGPQAPIWDTNPTAVNGAIFVAGSGTKLEAFNSAGAGGDPEQVRQYKLMCCMVAGVPETFLGDVSTGNLATASTLDRPTELVFLERQQSWQEDLVTIAKYFLKASKAAPSGRLREALKRRNVDPAGVSIVEMAKVKDDRGYFHYVAEAKRIKKPAELQVMCTFPAIREGDMVQNLNGIAAAMTLGNKNGTICGIDEKTGVLLLLKQLGVEDPEQIVDEMYPDSDYDPNRADQQPSQVPNVIPQTGLPPAPASTSDSGDDDDDTPPKPAASGKGNGNGKVKKSVPVAAHSRNAPTKAKEARTPTLYELAARLERYAAELLNGDAKHA